MKNWQDTLVKPTTTLREALEGLDRVGSQIVLVVDETRKLLGTVSDGDVRRGLLKGLALSDPISAAMHARPTCARHTDSRESILTTMRRETLHQVPIIDDAGIVVGLALIDDYMTSARRENWIVIMAGGLGSRLQELTRDTPKPMLKVGSRPLLETIVRDFAAQGFGRFYFAVNYKADQIESHFGDGSRLGVEIRYLRERQRMGTAGALSLLPERPALPFIVTNADLLTKTDYGRMVDDHVADDACATVAVRQYEMQVPFGVVRQDGNRIQAIEEKPVQRFLVSAGIYVLSPSVLDLVAPDTYLDMPTLFEQLMPDGRCASHEIDGYWLDIGCPPDYERANLEFHEVFK